jgi:hypothetical protein
VPERPIGTALKAVAGRNVSRGFESRPLCLKTYRLDRRFVLRALGINLALAGVAAGVAFVCAAVNAPEALATVVTLVAIALVANAVALILLPPVVIRSGSSYLRVGGRLTVRPVTVPWTDIEGVSMGAEHLYLDRGHNLVLAFPLAYVGRRADELVREVYDRLNAANGYKRFDPSSLLPPGD